MKESSLSGRYALLCMSVLLGLFLHGNALAGPITFDTALPVASREGILRGQYVLVRATDDPPPSVAASPFMPRRWLLRTGSHRALPCSGSFRTSTSH